MMAYTLVTRVAQFGKATCAWDSEPFVPKYAGQRCCCKGCASRLAWKRRKSDPVAFAATKRNRRRGGLEAARRARRRALDKLAARLHSRVSARDLQVFRLGWKLAIQTARERQQRRSGRVLTGAEEGVTAVG